MVRYFYYRVFTEDGAIDLKSPFDPSNKTLGRIDAYSIAPPHKVSSIKRRLTKEEGIADPNSTALYLHVEDDVPTDDSAPVKLNQEDGPGTSPDTAVGLVISESSLAVPKTEPEATKSFDVAGSWRCAEIGGGTRSNGTVTFISTSPTTFVGSGSETDTYTSGGQRSYSFNVVNGFISNTGSVSWVCDSAELNGKWRLDVVPSADGQTMTGVMTAVSGGVIGGSGTYTRVVY